MAGFAGISVEPVKPRDYVGEVSLDTVQKTLEHNRQMQEKQAMLTAMSLSSLAGLQGVDKDEVDRVLDSKINSYNGQNTLGLVGSVLNDSAVKSSINRATDLAKIDNQIKLYTDKGEPVPTWLSIAKNKAHQYYSGSLTDENGQPVTFSRDLRFDTDFASPFFENQIKEKILKELDDKEQYEIQDPLDPNKTVFVTGRNPATAASMFKQQAMGGMDGYLKDLKNIPENKNKSWTEVYYAKHPEQFHEGAPPIDNITAKYNLGQEEVEDRALKFGQSIKSVNGYGKMLNDADQMQLNYDLQRRLQEQQQAAALELQKEGVTAQKNLAAENAKIRSIPAFLGELESMANSSKEAADAYSRAMDIYYHFGNTPSIEAYDALKPLIDKYGKVKPLSDTERNTQRAKEVSAEAKAGISGQVAAQTATSSPSGKYTKQNLKQEKPEK